MNAQLTRRAFISSTGALVVGLAVLGMVRLDFSLLRILHGLQHRAVREKPVGRHGAEQFPLDPVAFGKLPVLGVG